MIMDGTRGERANPERAPDVLGTHPEPVRTSDQRDPVSQKSSSVDRTAR